MSVLADSWLVWLSGGLLVLLLAIAVRSDMMTRRIPNVLCLAIAVSGLALSTGLHGMVGLQHAAVGLIAGMLLLLPLYLLGGMGAGDAKLMAAVGAWLGMQGAILAAGLALLVGGAAAVMLLVTRNPAKQLPFAPAIATGTVMVAMLASWPLTS